MKPKTFLFTWLVAVIWTAVSWLSFYHPGDEYTLWVFGSMPGMWAIFFHGNQGDIHGFLLPVLAAGFATMIPFGFILDILRTSRRLFFGSWLLIAICLFAVTLMFADRPLERASTPKEGLILYSLAAINVGLWLTIIITLMGHFCLWAWAGMMRFLKRRPGAHPHPEAAKS